MQTIPLQILPIKPPPPQLPLPPILLLLIPHRLKPQLHHLPRLFLAPSLLFLHFHPRSLLRLGEVNLLLARGFVAPVCFAGFVPVLALHVEDATSVVGYGVVVVVVVMGVGAGGGGAVVAARAVVGGVGAGEFVVAGVGGGEEGGEEAHYVGGDLRSVNEILWR